MNTKHTPGPWQAWQTGYDNSGRGIGPNGKCPIAKTLGDHAAINKANAALISAAPELLAALKPFSELLEYPEEYRVGDTRMIQLQVSLDDIISARAAIAKATLA